MSELTPKQQQEIDKLTNKTPVAMIASVLGSIALTVPMGSTKQIIINALAALAVSGTGTAINMINKIRKIEKGTFKESVENYLEVMNEEAKFNIPNSDSMWRLLNKLNNTPVKVLENGRAKSKVKFSFVPKEIEGIQKSPNFEYLGDGIAYINSKYLK
jgi:hypothetical protein